eukprot:TRINITY_DN12621_c0_g1_i1.p1 TRINITY_DN12621_c0_g1~~TRINITY_DN12621_c0_g1_i1.p1  ORF type:complete len:675 (-),score=119.92 TRINITY_DN12621_c0_g1_i1:657-2681(-)
MAKRKAIESKDDFSKALKTTEVTSSDGISSLEEAAQDDTIFSQILKYLGPKDKKILRCVSSGLNDRATEVDSFFKTWTLGKNVCADDGFDESDGEYPVDLSKEKLTDFMNDYKNKGITRIEVNIPGKLGVWQVIKNKDLLKRIADKIVKVSVKTDRFHKDEVKHTLLQMTKLEDLEVIACDRRCHRIPDYHERMCATECPFLAKWLRSLSPTLKRLKLRSYQHDLELDAFDFSALKYIGMTLVEEWAPAQLLLNARTTLTHLNLVVVWGSDLASVASVADQLGCLKSVALTVWCNMDLVTTTALMKLLDQCSTRLERLKMLRADLTVFSKCSFKLAALKEVHLTSCKSKGKANTKGLLCLMNMCATSLEYLNMEDIDVASLIDLNVNTNLKHLQVLRCYNDSGLIKLLELSANTLQRIKIDSLAFCGDQVLGSATFNCLKQAVVCVKNKKTAKENLMQFFEMSPNLEEYRVIELAKFRDFDMELCPVLHQSAFHNFKEIVIVGPVVTSADLSLILGATCGQITHLSLLDAARSSASAHAPPLASPFTRLQHFRVEYFGDLDLVRDILRQSVACLRYFRLKTTGERSTPDLEELFSDADMVKFEKIMMLEVELSYVEDPTKLSAVHVQRIRHVFPADAQVDSLDWRRVDGGDLGNPGAEDDKTWKAVVKRKDYLL